jgi:hypothetical protein
MSNTQLLEKIDAAIAEKNLLKHPFYSRLARRKTFARINAALRGAVLQARGGVAYNIWETTGILRRIYPIIVRSCRGAKGRFGILTS